MSALFFFGTLRHLPLLQVVLGRDVPQAVPARLPGHALHWVRDQPFAMLCDGDGAEGLYLPDLSDEDIARLDFYEGGFGYALRALQVQTGGGTRNAQVYFPSGPAPWQTGDLWSLADWQARWGEMETRKAHEVMAHYGHTDAARVGALAPFFRARAWAQMLAQDAAPTNLRRATPTSDVQITPRTGGHDGFFRLRAFDVQYETFNGRPSVPAAREAFVAYDAALVLPYDPVTDHVVMIEQLRFGPLMRGDPAPWVLEPVAGLVDAGETPQDCARREALEEAGTALSELIPIANVYPSPGYSTEFFHCFLGLADLPSPGSHLGGLAAELEDIRAHVLPFDEAMALVASGEINAAPLVMMLLWLGSERANLRIA